MSCPVLGQVATRTPQLVLPSQLRFTNAAPALTSVELDAGDGQGYRLTAWDQPLTASYSANGTYTLRFRLTCADGTVLFSQARLDVQQRAAARYGDNNNGIDTYSTASLFTDVRPYLGASASGTVTVAYADNNSTRQIRKPLIVIEGYDASKALKSPQDNYSYSEFLFGNTFGGIDIVYTDYLSGNGSTVYFNNQLASQYDVVFLDYENGTDYIQRNAYLVERLIQWVNDNKQPLTGQSSKEPNIVMGMSMGGLVARYALRDMEVRRTNNPSLPAHDTRLYISHEAPHQGANVPLGFQYMVKSVANINIVAGFTLGRFVKELGNFVSLLNEPATQQLLIYQTDPDGAAVHQAWLAEYNQLGYPQQCRNVATSGGSECGRPQSFAPYSILVNIQGTGLLDKHYNAILNSLALTTGIGAGAFAGPLGLLIGTTVGAVFALGNYEGQADFVVNALPNRQQRRIYHGRFAIYKDILLGLFTTHALNYRDDNDCFADMLPYDSAPGGIYDIDQVSKGAISKISNSLPVDGITVFVQPRFCFVPTISALDIGGGQVAIGTQDLTASYSATAPPAAPRNTPFANFVTAGRDNLTHVLWVGHNSRWAFQEMQAAPQNISCQDFCQASFTITGPSGICANTNSTYGITGLPAGTAVRWKLSSDNNVPYTTASFTSPTFTVSYAGGGRGSGTVTASVSSDCGQLDVSKRVFFGAPEQPTFQPTGPFDGCPANQFATIQLTNYSPGLNYTLAAGGGIQLRGQLDAATGTFQVKGGGAGGTITVAAQNDCDTRSTQVRYIFDGASCGGSYAVYPNPADNQLTVEQTNDSQVQARSSQPLGSSVGTVLFTATLYDGLGTLRLNVPSTAALLQLSTALLPAGLYVLHLEANGVVVQRQVQIIH